LCTEDVYKTEGGKSKCGISTSLNQNNHKFYFHENLYSLNPRSDFNKVVIGLKGLYRF
jgi:hypothetical protein